MILALPDMEPWRPEHLALGHIRYNGSLNEFCESLQKEGFTIYDVPTVFSLLDTEYEISFTPEALQGLQERYDIDKNYDPFEPSQSLVDVYGFRKAGKRLRKKFESRRDNCPQPVKDLYSHYLERIVLEE